MSKRPVGLPFVIAIGALSGPSTFYGTFYVVAMMMGTSGGRWLWQGAFAGRLVAAWYLTALIGPLICVVVLTLDIILLARKGPSRKMKIAGSLITALCIASSTLVALQVRS
jgi:hypothetical protein